MKQPASLVVYRGPSAYDPSIEIMGILTRGSDNAKTGSMAQLFILRADVAPHTAQKLGLDAAVCGSCPLRPANKATGGGGCYVVTFQGPLSTWKAARLQPVAGAAEINALIRKAGSVRLGAYGDPAALPAHVVRFLSRCAGGKVTGYTHGASVLGFDGIDHLRGLAMLSVENPGAAEAAHAKGWRTFRATAPGAPNLASEITCPAETRGAKCADCLLCRGDSLGARSVTIPVHGFTRSSALRVVA
jgi:hypothetical protein